MNTYANRGMELEDIIELSNKHYLAAKQALIQKVPTPVKVLKTKKGGRIEGFWEKKSTVDFVGLMGKKPIAFDAKQTKGKSLPLRNIEKHQINFMLQWKRQGGEAFIVVFFSELDRFYRLDIKRVMQFIETSKRKSIPIEYFEAMATKIKNSYPLEYLEGIA